MKTRIVNAHPAPEVPLTLKTTGAETRGRLYRILFSRGRKAFRRKIMRMRNMLKSKLHKARVTDAHLEYEGSISIDEELMEMADIVPYEFVLVSNANNGERFETYVIPGPRGKRQICLNGATARKGLPGDVIFIFSLTYLAEDQVRSHKPRVILLDENNNPKN